MGYHRQTGNGKVRFGGEARETKLRCKSLSHNYFSVLRVKLLNCYFYIIKAHRAQE